VIPELQSYHAHKRYACGGVIEAVYHPICSYFLRPSHPQTISFVDFQIKLKPSSRGITLLSTLFDISCEIALKFERSSCVVSHAQHAHVPANLAPENMDAAISAKNRTHLKRRKQV
jgi:hypothetical protein